MEHQPEEYYARLDKLTRLQAEGQDPFAVHRYERTHRCGEVAEAWSSNAEVTVAVAGRLMAVRRHGKGTFADLRDESGKLQVQAGAGRMGEERYAAFGGVDVGDVVGVRGTVGPTKTGEMTVWASEWTLLAKALRPLPEKYHGLRDVEVRSRQRYLDLIANPEVRDTFTARSQMIRAARKLLDEKHFTEVETPVMQAIYGGAAARPFTTHHNALDMDLYLRIAPELYLKRLIVGGLERVYEIGRVFRNEGIDTRHNPEFTILEAYQAYADYEDMMELTEQLVVAMAEAAVGGKTIEHRGERIDLSPPWARLSFFGALEKATGIDLSGLERDEEAAEMAPRLGIEDVEVTSLAELFDRAFERHVQPGLIGPTFVIDYPLAMSPLAKRHAARPNITARFEPFLCGEEIGNAFSELNDPLDQRKRFEEQVEKRAKGELEAHPLDEDFLLALEYGMPPTGGLGIGIDRLAMLLLDKPSIREVILFPLLRPEGGAND
jgi:lysyl-tRNA synthetase class 2